MKNRIYNHLTSNGKIPLLQVISWILYDAANSFFQTGIASLYYGLWIIQDMGAKEYQYGWAISIAQLLLILTGPIMGSMADTHHKKKIFLVAFTIQAVIATVFLKTNNIFLSLIFFTIAYHGMQMGQIVYDSYLVEISTKKTRPLISGYGIGAGQIGHIIIILTMLPLVEKFGRGATFAPIGFLFLLLGLPALMFLRQRSVKARPGLSIGQHINQVMTTFRHLKYYPGSLRFFIARFFYNDTLQTVYVFIVIYFSTVFKFSDFELQVYFASMLVFSVISGLLSGHIMARIGSKKFLSVILAVMTIGFLVLTFASLKIVVILIGIVLGIVQGGIWSTDRVIITKLSPRRKLAEFFGIYGIMNRFATILGPLIWGLVIYSFTGYGIETAHRIAMGVMVLFGAISLLIFLPLQIKE